MASRSPRSPHTATRATAGNGIHVTHPDPESATKANPLRTGARLERIPEPCQIVIFGVDFVAGRKFIDQQGRRIPRVLGAQCRQQARIGFGLRFGNFQRSMLPGRSKLLPTDDQRNAGRRGNHDPNRGRRTPGRRDRRRSNRLQVDGCPNRLT